MKNLGVVGQTADQYFDKRFSIFYFFFFQILFQTFCIFKRLIYLIKKRKKEKKRER